MTEVLSFCSKVGCCNFCLSFSNLGLTDLAKSNGLLRQRSVFSRQSTVDNAEPESGRTSSDPVVGEPEVEAPPPPSLVARMGHIARQGLINIGLTLVVILFFVLLLVGAFQVGLVVSVYMVNSSHRVGFCS